MCQQYLQAPTRTPHRQQVNHKPFEHSLHSSCPHKGHLEPFSIAVSSFGRDGHLRYVPFVTAVTSWSRGFASDCFLDACTKPQNYESGGKTALAVESCDELVTGLSQKGRDQQEREILKAR
jgi:hypothetical protein